jgi:predicted TIM-barrel fold metal-dependent hydrolase
MPPVIDAHAHLLPEPLVAALRNRAEAPDIRPDPTGGESFGIYRTRMPYGRAYDDLDARLARMETLGVDRQILSLPGLFGIDSRPASQALPLVRAFNDGIAGIIRQHPAKFVGIAALPLADMTASVEEYRRARGLGLSGLILPGDAFVSTAAAERVRPLFDLAAAIGGVVFVHPGPLPDGTGGAVDTPAPHTDSIVHRRVTVDIQNRMTEVMVTLALTDFLDPYPGVPVQVANLGGALPFVIERMDHVYALRHMEAPAPSRSLRPLYVDAASLGPRAITLAAEVYGADRVLFGSDTPIFDDGRCLQAVRDARLSAAERAGIACGNAERLLAEAT